MRVIYTSKNRLYRIIEIADLHSTIEELSGDCFKAEVNPHIPAERLEAEFSAFVELVNREGTYGYVLETWDSAPDCGWVPVDSCFGFVGQYTPTKDTFNHYIVDELKSQIAGDK